MCGDSADDDEVIIRGVATVAFQPLSCQAMVVDYASDLLTKLFFWLYVL